MITLEDDSLTFSFPEIAEQVGALVDGHVKSTLRTLALPSSRGDLDDAMDRYLSGSRLQSATTLSGRQITPAAIRKLAESFTSSDLEGVIREAILANAELSERTPELTISFQRTMRIPDDGREYPLPAGFGSFPLRSVDDHQATVPETWSKRGGTMMPMYQSEALWIDFFIVLPVRGEGRRGQD